MEFLLSVCQLTKRFDNNPAPVVDGVSFDVLPGEIFALLGPSGCGKTTTLRLIAGFEKTDVGEITFEGQLIGNPMVHTPPETRKLGFVFQDYALFPHLSVSENVAFGLKGWQLELRRERVMEVLEMVELAPLKDRKPHQLSGGEQQRVALARSIAPRPKLILLDEPFTNLDAGMRQTTREEVREMLKSAGMSAVLVTHDQEEALSFADRLAVMQDGGIEQTGTPEEVYYSPATPFVADFLGKTNLLAGEAKGDYAETPLGRLSLDCRAEGRVQLSIRPEHLRMVYPQAGEASGEVVMREFKGHDLTYRVQIGDTDYLVQTDYQCPFQTGDRVELMAVEPAVVVKKPRST